MQGLEMADRGWTMGVARLAREYFGGFSSREELQAAWRPWVELTAAVAEFLTAENLKALEPDHVYSRIVNLFEDRPRMRGRFKSLLCFQDGGRLKEALLRLVTVREHGDRGRRIDALDLGGLGRATASEILCLWRPYRFLPQNTVTTAALARLTEVYRARDLVEMSFDMFMDLAGSLEEGFRGAAAARWPELAEQMRDRRYLYFYAFLSERDARRGKR